MGKYHFIAIGGIGMSGLAKYLLEDGCTFMTPSEYTDLVKAQEKNPQLYPRNINVSVDGEYLEFDVPPQVINSRVMVPFRKIFESLGANVMYDEYGKIAIAYIGSRTVKIGLGDDTVYINSKPVKSDVTPAAINGRFLSKSWYVLIMSSLFFWSIALLSRFLYIFLLPGSHNSLSKRGNL